MSVSLRSTWPAVSTAVPTTPKQPRRVASAMAESGPPAGQPAAGSGDQVKPLLSTEQARRLFDSLRSPNPMFLRLVKEKSLGLSGAALVAYVEGQGGLRRLPSDTFKSNVYFKDPARKNTDAMLYRAFSGDSSTKAARDAWATARDMRPGQSVRYEDTQDTLIDLFAVDNKQLPATERDRGLALGNATLHTKAVVTLTKDSQGNVQARVDTQHTLVDRYNWNAGKNDSATSAARTMTLPDGKGGTFQVNHADWYRMKQWGAKDFWVGYSATTQQTYTIPATRLQRYEVRSAGEFATYAVSATSPKAVTDDAQFSKALSEAAGANKLSVPPSWATVRELKPLQ
jgi:hypothetical protein